MVIKLEKYKYDPFIDFLKGISILSVVFTHLGLSLDKTGFCYWGYWCVPIFILIQVFHAYKNEQVSFDLPWLKFYKRIVRPFAAITFLMFLIKCLMCGSYNEFIFILKRTIIEGGIGPGSYYPWIYLQLFMLLPYLRKTLILGRLSGGGYLVVAILLEMICSIINIPEWLYRLLFFRFIFLIFLGYLWVVKGIEINKKTIFLSILSLIAITIFNYSKIDFEPIFYTTGFKIHHWICFFYPATLLIYFIRCIYNKLPQKFIDFIRLCGKFSYEIFLWQMFVFSFYGQTLKKILVSIGFENNQIITGLIILSSFCVCLLPLAKIYFKKKLN